MPEFERLSDRLRHTRRNFVKIGASATLAVLYRFQQATAQEDPDDGRKPPCFLRGMRVRTAAGDRPVQDLRTGDRIPTVFGGMRSIKSIFSFSYQRRDPSQPWDRHALPVRIAPSALAPGVPHADLYLTRGHSLLIDGILFPASSLINGATITWYEARELNELEYFHIKFDSHDAVYVEGAPCESQMPGDEDADSLLVPPAPCAPLGFNGGFSEVRSCLRSAISPWFECRHKADIIRDALDRRASILVQER